MSVFCLAAVKAPQGRQVSHTITTSTHLGQESFPSAFCHRPLLACKLSRAVQFFKQWPMLNTGRQEISGVGRHPPHAVPKPWLDWGVTVVAAKKEQRNRVRQAKKPQKGVQKYYVHQAP